VPRSRALVARQVNAPVGPYTVQSIPDKDFTLRQVLTPRVTIIAVVPLFAAPPSEIADASVIERAHPFPTSPSPRRLRSTM